MTVQPVDDFQMETGLEDFSLSDGTIPRISIDHNTGQWKLNITGDATYSRLDVIMLGLVKQRILWDVEVEDGEGPLCRSNGTVNPAEPMMGNPDADKFPWDASGFNRAEFQPDGYNNLNLPCDSCRLKEWGSHPQGKTPWCSQQHTIPMLLNMATLDGSEFDANVAEWMPALYSASKTALKPSNSYITPFSAGKKPLFTVITEMTLRLEKKGSRPYAVPVFGRKAATDQDSYMEYSAMYRQMRDFLTAPRDNRTDEQREAAATGGNALPQEASNGQAAAATPAPQPAPAAQAPAQQAPPAQTAPTPVAPHPAAPAPSPQPAPPVQTTQPAPAPSPQVAPAAPAPTPAQAGPATPPDDLPF